MKILSSERYVSLSPTSVEEEAIRIRWKEVEKRDGDIPEEDAVRLLIDIRDRSERVERHALSVLRKHTSENRRTPRRHQALAFLIIFAFIGIALLISFLRSLF